MSSLLPRGEVASIAILRTADVVRRYLANVIAPFDVTFQQYNVLRILRGAYPKPLPTLEIGDRLIEKMPGITRLLDRLEEKGLVHRVRCAEDRRTVHCSITPKGLELLKSMDNVVNAADLAPTQGMASEDVETLIRLLDTVRNRVEG